MTTVQKEGAERNRYFELILGMISDEKKGAVMEPAAEMCASTILSLCADFLGKEIETVEELVEGWNRLRRDRGLRGEWRIEGDTVTAVFYECGCPIVRSGMAELDPLRCFCSRSMMHKVFSTLAPKAVDVDLVRTIARGDEVCEFLVKLKAS